MSLRWLSWSPALDRWSLRLAVAVLLLLVLVGLPLFLCMSLYADVTTFDLGARNLLRGGVHYRDAYDNGLPGMVWLHVAIRALLGWRSEVIRAVDFLMMALSVGLLVLWLRSMGLTRTALAWAAVVLVGFYFATPEVCHCQRDLWMLPPALAALYLRRRQVAAALRAPGTLGGVAVRAAVEGICWGIAFWIKPFVGIPAVVCWLIAAGIIWRGSARPSRVLAADALGLIAGGLVAGGPGVAWLWWSGSWPYFWDTVFGWDADYYHLATHGVLRRTGFLIQLFLPWGWVHVAAVPIAVMALGRALVMRGAAKEASSSGIPQEALLGGFYLAWLLQANYLQYGYLYQLAPTFLLALAVIAGRRWLPGDSPLGWIILVSFLALAVARHPLIRGERIGLWTRCVREGSSPELQNRLSLSTEPRKVDWVALSKVADFLRGVGVRDGELTCYSFGTSPLYLQLDVRPSTRFVSGIEDMIVGVGSGRRREMVRAELAASPQRYVVTDLQFLTSDLQSIGLLRTWQADGGGSGLIVPADIRRAIKGRYPWSEPVIFRAGPYLVHRDTGSLRQN